MSVLRLVLLLLSAFQKCYGGKECSEQLGLEDGSIKDSQITASSAFNNDFSTYGGHQARLNKRTWPPGYRSDSNSWDLPWLKVEFNKPLVVTSIATQGYGDDSVAEWMTEYYLFYADLHGSAFKAVSKSDNETFVANKDRDSVKLNYLSFPVVTKSVLVLSKHFHRNVAFRMELYGCEPGYYFVVWLMVRNETFRHHYMYSYTEAYKNMKIKVIYKVNQRLERVPGYISTKLIRFSPKPFDQVAPYLVAELEIYCLERENGKLLNEIQKLIKQDKFFEGDVPGWTPNYPLNKNCLPPSIDIGLHKNPYETEDPVQRRPLIIQLKTIGRCNEKDQKTIVGCSGTGIWEKEGIFKYFRMIKRWGKTNKYKINRRYFSLVGKAKLAYIMCYVKLEVNKTIHGENYDYGYIQLEKNKIVAKLKGQDFVIRGMKVLIFDAYESYHTLLPWNGYKELNYSWTLVQSKQNNRVNSSLLPAILADGVKVAFNISDLDSTTYNITLFVSGARKNATAEKQVQILDKPKVYIRCKRNCGPRNKGNASRVFQLFCEGRSCEKSKVLEWHTRYDNHSIKSVCVGQVYQRRNSTLELFGFTCPGIGTLEVIGILHFSNNYTTLQVVASFSLIIANTSRTCSVSPISGTVLKTNFNISCVGWADGGLFPVYDLFLMTDAGPIDVLLNESSVMLTVLPTGDPNQDYKLNLDVNVSYPDGEEECISLDVKVFPISPSNIFNIFKPGSNFTARFLSLVKKGEINKASVIAIAALSVFKGPPNYFRKFENASLSFSLMSNKVKTDVLKNYKNVSINRVDQVSKFLYVIALCSDQKYATSDGGYDLQQNQMNALNILETTTDFVTVKLESVQAKTRKRISKVAFSSLGSIIKSASSDAKTKPESNTVHQDKETIDIQKERKMKAEQIVKKAIKITKKVGQYMSSVLTLEEQSTIVTPYMAMLILKGNKKTFSDKTVHFHNAIVRLPSTEVLFAGTTIKRYDLFDLKIILWRVNPLTWHYSSNSIKSAVIDVTLSISQVASIVHGNNSMHERNRSVNNEADLTECKQNHEKYNTKCNNTVHRQRNRTDDFKKNITQDGLSILNLTVPIQLFIPKYGDEVKNLTKSGAESEEFFVKPSTDEKDFLTYHQINVTSSYVSISVNVKPASDVELDLYIKYNEKPTSKDYHLTRRIPNYSSCSHDLHLKKYVNCSLDPNTFTFSSKDSGHTGLHYLGIRYLPSFYNRTRNHTKLHETKHLVIRVRKALQDPCIGAGKRQKRSCAEYKKSPTPRPAPTYKRNVLPLFENLTDIKYTLDITSGTCMFWNVEDQQWSRKGCKLGSNSTRNSVHCLCDHLTTFGGDFFVAPNPIDFSRVFKAFQSLDDTGNTGTLITICVLLMLFVIGLFVTRRYDKIDERKNVNRTIEMQGIANEDPHTYQIQLETGIWRGSGTTANVGIIIYGDHGCTEPICITTRSDDDSILFARGSINTFNLLLNKSLGNLIKIKIWHDNTGTSPSWYAHQVMITDKKTIEKKHFFINRWLAVDKRDGRIVTEKKAFNKSDGNSFRDFFTLRTARGFANDHLWVSLFTRPPHNPFTRSQRLACCMSILFAAMIANAMFYELGSKAGDDKFNIGPIQINLYAIRIGVQSSFMVIPINVIIVMLFKKACNMENEDELTEGKERCLLSRIMVALAWVLCCIVILASAAFVVFYSMQWGKETSNNWLASIVVSSIQDIFITSPIKVVCIAVILSAILTKPPKEDDIRYQKKASKVVNASTIEQPEDEDLEKARLYEEQTEEMLTVIRNLFRLIVLFILFMTVCYGNRDRSRFMFTKSVQDVFRGFDKVRHHKQFWNWTRVVLVPGLFGTQWYNHQPFKYEEGFISNRELFLVGMPRLRQLRVKPVEKCSAQKQHPFIADIFHRCLPSYSLKHEDRGPYYMQGWKTISNISLYKTKSELDAICPEHWRYQTDDSQKSFFMMKNSYTNGGYIAELGYNSNFALKTIQNLVDNDWLDDFTAAVFIEFTLFEPASRLLCVVRYVYKKHLHGRASTSMYIKTLVIYPPSDAKSKIFMYASKIALLIYITILILFEMRQVYVQRWRYFKSIWNWFEMFLLSLCAMAMVMTSFVQYYASNFVQGVEKNPYKTWATDGLVFYSDFEICLFGIILFILTVKTLKIVSFNRPVLVMLMSLKSASKPLASFSMVFFTAITAFAMLAHLAFGNSMLAYSSLQHAFFDILQVGSFGGDLKFKKLYKISPMLGPFYIFFLRFVITLVLVNMFIAILNFSYALSSAEMRANKPFKNLIILNFAKLYFKSLILSDIKNFLVNLWKVLLQKISSIHTVRKESFNCKFTKKSILRERLKHEGSCKCNCVRRVSSDDDIKVSIESIYCEKHNQVETRTRPSHINGRSKCFSRCITGCCERRISEPEEGILEEDFTSSHPQDYKSLQRENPICRNFSSENSIVSYNRAVMPRASREEEMSTHSDSSYDGYDDIEFIDEDYFIADMKKSLSEIRSSIAGSFQSLSSCNPSRPHSMHLPQRTETKTGSPSSPSGSLLYSTSPSRSELSLSRSRRSFESQSNDECDSEWSFSSSYYRIEGDSEYRG